MWWAMRVMDIAEWIITLAKATYYNVKSRDKVDCVCNNMFSVDIVLQILVFMEAFSQDFPSGCPWELLNADDLAIVTESLEEVKNKLLTWKLKFFEKSRKVNASTTKVLISDWRLNTIKVPLNFHAVQI